MPTEIPEEFHISSGLRYLNDECSRRLYPFFAFTRKFLKSSNVAWYCKFINSYCKVSIARSMKAFNHGCAFGRILRMILFLIQYSAMS